MVVRPPPNMADQQVHNSSKININIKYIKIFTCFILKIISLMSMEKKKKKKKKKKIICIIFF